MKMTSTMDLLVPLLSTGTTDQYHLPTQGSIAKQEEEVIARRGQEVTKRKDILRKASTRKVFIQSRSTHPLCHLQFTCTTHDFRLNIIDQQTRSQECISLSSLLQYMFTLQHICQNTNTYESQHRSRIRIRLIIHQMKFQQWIFMFKQGRLETCVRSDMKVVK